jgi:integrase
MARTARASNLETRSARLKKLEPRGKPYYARSGAKGVHLGYRRTAKGNGSWLVKRYVGRDDGAGGKYETEVFAEADDYSDADGAAVLDYFQAMKRLSGELSEVQRSARYTVRDAVADYLAWFKLNRKSARDAEWKLRAYLTEAKFKPDAAPFGDRLLSSLTPADFDAWQTWAFTHRPPGRRKKAKTAKPAAKAPHGDQARRRKSTLNRVINLVKACLNRAYEGHKVSSDSAWRRLRRYKGADAARQHWLTIDEAKRLTNACAPDFRRVVQAGLLTGARWGELRNLKARDFDHHSGTVLIAESKAGKSRRIPLTDERQSGFRIVDGRP